MRKSLNYGLAVGALVAAGVLGTSDADASPISVIGTYTISETYSDQTNSNGGGPVITGNFGTGIVNSSTGTTGNFSLSLTAGAGNTSAVNLATFSPDNNCQGPGCSGVTETDPISISFTFTSPSEASATTDTATFTAKYSGSDLTCSGESGFGQTDCIDWGTSPITAHFTDGAVMNITLNDAQDWNITPTIQFALINGPDSVPAPGNTLGLLGIGMIGTVGAIGWRRRQSQFDV
jgi:hypothetical protein